MTLIKTSILNSIAVVVKTITSLALNKVLAVYVEPAGYALIGQFQNFVSMLTAFAGGAVNTGVTKYTAEHFDDKSRQQAIWRTAGAISLVGSLTLGLVVALMHRHLSQWIFKDESLANVFLWFGAALVLFAMNALLLAILNGKKEIGRYVIVNIAGSLIGLLMTGLLAFQWGLYGALVALAINQSLILVITIAVCWRTPWFFFRDMLGEIDPKVLRALGKFALMALTVAVCVPISQMLIRDHLGGAFGWEAAGYWEALNRISGLYLMMVTTPLTVYYLPRLSEIRKKAELRQEILHGYCFILPIATIFALAIYLMRDWIILTLFTAEFVPMHGLFAWQMVGDVLKIGSWLLAYLMLAKALTRTFIITEILFSISFVVLVFFFTAWIGLNGVVLAYAVNYGIYWVAMIFIVNRQVFSGVVR